MWAEDEDNPESPELLVDEGFVSDRDLEGFVVVGLKQGDIHHDILESSFSGYFFSDVHLLVVVSS